MKEVRDVKIYEVERDVEMCETGRIRRHSALRDWESEETQSCRRLEERRDSEL